MMMNKISVSVNDKRVLSNTDNLSLLSIASVLRKGLLCDEDSDYEKYHLQPINSDTGELVNIDIDENINSFSIDSLKKKSEVLSTVGNKCAHNGQYLDAIRYYSKAIALFDEDYRLFCNRSYCYERLMNYEDSLADALRSVILMPTKAKPYFRQGKALMGLKRYNDAEKAFNKILKLDANCEETKQELMKTRYLALRDYGLNIEKASIFAINHNSIDEAIEALHERKNVMLMSNTETINSINWRAHQFTTSNSTNYNANYLNGVNGKLQLTEMASQQKSRSRLGSYKRSQSRPPSRTDAYNFNATTVSNVLKTSFMHKRSHSVDNLLRYKQSDNFIVKKTTEYRLPKNLFGYKGLWIGNVSPACKVVHLRSIFSKYGTIDYANVVGSSFCAFVNYHSSNAPRVAIANLYGQVIAGVSNGDRPLVFRFIPGNDQKDLHYMRPYQPKGTNECYFWRTTGCKDFNCPLLHYPICKGIDFQPWMAKKNKKFFNQ